MKKLIISEYLPKYIGRKKDSEVFDLASILNTGR